MTSLWPHIGAATWRLVQEVVEPKAQEVLAGYRINGFRFQKVELGRLPPRVHGVAVHTGDKDHVALDLDIVYTGDARVQISVMKISAGVSDLHLRGRLRVKLMLVDSLPIVGGIQVFFLDTPTLDFELDGAANILEIPGLNGLLQQVVMDQLTANLVLPNKVRSSSAAFSVRILLLTFYGIFCSPFSARRFMSFRHNKCPSPFLPPPPGVRGDR